MLPIEGVIPMMVPHALAQAAPVAAPAPGGAQLFEQLLSGIANDANQSLKSAEQAGAAFAAGAKDDIHGTMLELSKADIELRFVGNVRNRVIDAFYELWRMQI
jgi:flagellar hook-basal body complex protein FliE